DCDAFGTIAESATGFPGYAGHILRAIRVTTAMRWWVGSLLVCAAVCGCSARPTSDAERPQASAVAKSPAPVQSPAVPASATGPTPVAEIYPGFLAGYLGEDLPDSL